MSAPLLLVAFLLAAMQVLQACTRSGAAASSSPSAESSLNAPSTATSATPLRDFVGVRGTDFYADGRPFRFVGFNLFDAAGRPGGYHCAWWGALSDDELDAALGRMRAEAGATVLRFWAFQSYTAGGTDWAGIDRVVRLAKRHGLRLMPVLENGMPHCTEGGPDRGHSSGWYADASHRDYRYGHPLSLPDYIERVVSRYRDEPAILAWMIMNEAETDKSEALLSFAREMTALVKRVDPNHLVAFGTQSTGQAGARGADLLRLHALSSIDFVSGHDWDSWGDDDNPLPGSVDGRSLPDAASCSNFRALGCSVAQSLHILNKPFVIDEAGIKAWPIGGYSPQQRAALLGAKMDAAFAAGVAGYLIWQWSTVVDEGYDILRGDPLLGAMRRRATWLAHGLPFPLPAVRDHREPPYRTTPAPPRPRSSGSVERPSEHTG